MKRFLRNALIGVVSLLLIVVIFWQTLVATATWGVVVYRTWGDSTAQPIGTSERLLGTATTSETTIFNSLSVPHTFASTSVLNETDSIIVIREVGSNAYYLVSPMTPFALSLQNGSDGDDCATYTSVFQTNPCNSDQQFLRALVSTNINNTHLFSSRELKHTTAVFTTLRTSYFPNKTTRITPVHSTYMTGHLVHAGNRSIAYIFDINNQGYELTFVNMTEDEILAVISGLTPILDTAG